MSGATSPPVVVITGPSGVGKGTLIRGLREQIPELELSISATTRSPRPGEEDGREYYFLGEEEFLKHVAAGDFLEHATYSGNHYGTLREEIGRLTQAGQPVVLEIELQGARQIRQTLPTALQVFIDPPSVEALKTRLIGRGTDPPEQITQRLETAEQELQAKGEFTHVVTNDRLEDAIAALTEIVGDALDHDE